MTDIPDDNGYLRAQRMTTNGVLNRLYVAGPMDYSMCCGSCLEAEVAADSQRELNLLMLMLGWRKELTHSRDTECLYICPDCVDAEVFKIIDWGEPSNPGVVYATVPIEFGPINLDDKMWGQYVGPGLPYTGDE